MKIDYNRDTFELHGKEFPIQDLRDFVARSFPGLLKEHFTKAITTQGKFKPVYDWRTILLKTSAKHYFLWTVLKH